MGLEAIQIANTVYSIQANGREVARVLQGDDRLWRVEGEGEGHRHARDAAQAWVDEHAS